MTPPRTALVAGGGIAGTATALALQKAGIEPVIVEARTGPADGEGAFLTLGSNGFEALRQLDADGPALAAGFPTPALTRRFSSTCGYVVSSDARSPSVRPVAAIVRSTLSDVARPSPVNRYSEKMTWPDCSPPSERSRLIISSITYLSPTGQRTSAMPASRSAISRPMLLITVATTASPLRRPSALICLAHSSITASPSTTLPAASTKIARSPSPSYAMPSW